MQLVIGKRYKMKSGQEVIFESLVPNSDPPQALVSDPLDESYTFKILIASIEEESDQRWRGTIIP
jgi:hypothetical protein